MQSVCMIDDGSAKYSALRTSYCGFACPEDIASLTVTNYLEALETFASEITRHNMLVDTGLIHKAPSYDDYGDARSNLNFSCHAALGHLLRIFRGG
jgi:hypothetical protein